MIKRYLFSFCFIFIVALKASAANDASVTLYAKYDPVISGQNVTLSWESMNATSCEASNGWTGSKAISGEESVATSGTSITYQIECTGPTAVSFTDSVTVDVLTGSQFYVDKNDGACDDNGVGSESVPWCTVGKANSTLTAGEIVWIKTGTYQEQIRPASSGTTGNPVTYVEYPGDSVIISTEFSSDSYCVNLIDRDWIIIDGFTLRHCSSDPIEMTRSDNSIIRNNVMTETYVGVLHQIYLNGASFNKIQNNVFDSTSSSPDCESPFTTNCNAAWEAIRVYNVSDSNPVPSHHNVIEYNDFGRVSHQVINAQTNAEPKNHHNVYRLNDMHNVWHTILGLFPTDLALVERNTIRDNKTQNSSNPYTPSRGQPGGALHLGSFGSPLSAIDNIVRRNVFYNNNRVNVSAAEGNKIYHNVFYGTFNTFLFSDSQGKGNLNNPFYNNAVDNTVLFEYCCGGTPDTSPYFSNNIEDSFDDDGPTRTLAQMQSTYPLNWIDNINQPALFTNTTTHDFTLQESSNLINAGRFLTTTDGSGSGTSMIVVDASFFVDGWDIVKGDVIQTASGKTARVTDIINNTLTLHRSISWSSGEGVSLPYSGTAPDIGANEFMEALTPPEEPVGLLERIFIMIRRWRR